MSRLPVRLGLPLLAALLLAGCAQTGPPLPPSLELPRRVNDLRASRKGSRVRLEWTVPAKTMDGQSVRSLGPTRVCRDLTPLISQPCTVVGQVAGAVAGAKAGVKTVVAYTDVLPVGMQESDPTGFVSYAVEVLNAHGRSAGVSNWVLVAAVPTLPPVANFSAQVTAQGVALTWACPSLPAMPPQLRYLLRIYRQGDAKSIKVADLSPGICTVPDERESFVDQTFEWEKNYRYRATLVTAVTETGKPEVEVEGDDTPEIDVATHDVFPPSVPSGVQAVATGGTQPFVDLTWTPVAEADVAGYNVYRHEAGAESVKLNADLVKTASYLDSAVEAGKTYVYSVSAVDLRGNESGRSEEASEAVTSSQ